MGEKLTKQECWEAWSRSQGDWEVMANILNARRKSISLDTAQLGQEPHFGCVEDADSTFCDDPKCWCATKDFVRGYNAALRATAVRGERAS